MAKVFVPPTAPGRPYALRRDRPYSSLFRFYGGIPTGINVFLLVGGDVTTVEPADPSDVLRTFHGGHIHPVDETEATALTVAGFAANLSVVDDPVAPSGLPGFNDGEWNTGLTPVAGLPGTGTISAGEYDYTPELTPNAPSLPGGFPSFDDGGWDTDLTPVEGLPDGNPNDSVDDPDIVPVIGGFGLYGGGAYGEGYYGGSGA